MAFVPQSSVSPFNLIAKKAIIWLQIALSYSVVGAILATLVCAYLEEVHQIVIAISLLISTSYGIFIAEKVRNSTGLLSHKRQIDKHQLDF